LQSEERELGTSPSEERRRFNSTYSIAKPPSGFEKDIHCHGEDICGYYCRLLRCSKPIEYFFFSRMGEGDQLVRCVQRLLIAENHALRFVP
jgi:hypothetical protein